MFNFFNLLYSIFPLLPYNNLSIDQVKQKSRPSPLGVGIYFGGLLELPPGWITALPANDAKHPPIKLDKPTNITIPSHDRIRFHLKSATQSYCFVSKSLYANCFFGNCQGFKLLKVFDNDYYGGLVIVGYYHKTREIVVSHRGTFLLQNWLSDLSYELVEMNGLDENIKVHNGFYKIYNSYSEQLNKYLLNLLKDERYKGYKVILTGQSLGAALATIHAAEQTKAIEAAGYKAEVFAYHSPRVGNRAFVDHFIGLDIPIARYSNRGDPVSMVGWRHMGYVHVPGEVNLPQFQLSDKLKVCDQGYDEDPKCGWTARYTINPLDHLNGFNLPVIPIC